MYLQVLVLQQKFQAIVVTAAIPSERLPTGGNSEGSAVKGCVDFPLYLTLS